MLSRLEQRLASIAEWTFNKEADAVCYILKFIWKLSKYLMKMLWVSTKFTAWSMTKKNFWKGLFISSLATSLCLLLAITIPYFHPYKGGYFGYKNKVLQDKEIKLINQVKEYERKKDQLKMLEELSLGKVDAVKKEVQRLFKNDWKGMYATIQAENRDKDGYFNCKVVQDWMNPDGTTDYGLGQVNTVHLWMVDNNPEKLLDCRTNIAVLYRIWDRADGVEGNGMGNLTPWVAYKDGRAYQFLANL